MYLSISAVRLITDEHFNDVLACVHLDLFEPVLQRLEGLAIIDSIGHDYSHRTLVIGLGDGFKALLAGCIPDLHSDLFAIHLNRLDLEVNAYVIIKGSTDGGEMARQEVVLAEA